MNYFLSAFIGIIIGSLPTAYILLKYFKQINITENGSSNVGAFNSFKVSKSKVIGLLVLIIDILKGALTVTLIKILIGDEFIYLIIGIIGAVLSHCYSFWINFKGGRGLATAAGGAILISIPVLVIWFIIWLIAFLLRKNVHFSNISATILSAALSFSSAKFLIKYSSSKANSEMEFSLLITFLMLIIFIRHIEPLKQYYKKMLKERKYEQT